MNELNEIVEEFYKVFGKYPVSFPLKDVCTLCCLKEPFHSELANSDVRQISYEALYQYNEAAYAYELNMEETKHFIPRQIELLTEFNPPKIEPSLMFDRLQREGFANWNWSEKELYLFKKFSEKYFKVIINQTYGENNMAIEEAIILLNNIGANISELLKIWELEKSKISILHFASLVGDTFRSCKNLQKGKFHVFATKELSSLVSNWILSKATKKIFITKIESLIGEEYKEEYNNCYLTLEILKSCD